jgi:hypothetical protein
MIEFTKSYKTADGQVFGSLEMAQLHELETLLGGVDGNINCLANISKHLLKHKDLLIDVLTTTPNSKPKARSVNGGTKKRKVVITDATTSVHPSDSDNK